MGLYEDLKSISPFSLAFHDDADGVYSASLLLLTEGIEIKRLKESDGDMRLNIASPPFGEYTQDVAVDLGSPTIEGYNGLVIDHHPDHPAIRKYKLYWDRVPTGLILWNELKDHIPKEEWWRVAGSLSGDASIELCPSEIWEMFPELLDEKGVIYKEHGYRTKMSRYPIYVYLSSGINAMCRIGNPLGALEMCMKYRKPIDAVIDTEAMEAKKLVQLEEANIMRQNPVVEIIKNRFAVVRIKTTRPSISMSGLIASSLSNEYKFLTLVVINETNGEVSMRGILAKYLADKLRKLGYKTGGHAVASGGQIPITQIDNFVNDIRRI